jgi:tetratricopeptide (TPR) repeat protein
VKEALDRAAAKIGERFQNQPLVEAAIRSAIGEAYRGVTRHELAISHFQRSVALRRASLGPNHRETLSSQVRLATAYTDVQMTGEAIAILEGISDQVAGLLGPGDPDPIDYLKALAQAYRRHELCELAIDVMSALVEKRKLLSGPLHPATISAVHNLADCYLSAGRLTESIELHEQALALSTATNGPDHPETVYIMRTYSRALQGAWRLEEADRVLRCALEGSRKQAVRRDHEIALVQRILGLNLLLQERYVEAEPVAREALAILEKNNPEDWNRFHAMSLVGGALLGQQRYAESEPFLVRGYEGMKERAGSMDPGFKQWLTKAGQRLAHFYELTDQPEEAREMREPQLMDEGLE